MHLRRKIYRKSKGLGVRGPRKDRVEKGNHFAKERRKWQLTQGTLGLLIGYTRRQVIENEKMPLEQLSQKYRLACERLFRSLELEKRLKELV